MTQREKVILEIITENPMISQNELASMLGIARSSVAVHVSNLVQEGLLKGRGYIINQQNHPVIIGSANADIYCKVNPQQHNAKAAESRFLDVNIKISYGGIAKNVAEGLVRLGSTPTLITAVGNGLLGSEIIRDCNEANISTLDIMVRDDNTSTYLEVQDANGEKMFVGLSDVTIEKNLAPESLQAKRSLLNNSLLILTEDSMSGDALQYVSSTYPKNKPMLLCTYPERAHKYKDFIDQFSFVMMSDEVACELAQVSKHASFHDDGILEIARSIANSGLTKFLIVYGADSLCLVEPGRISLSQFTSHDAAGDTTYDHCRDTIASAVIKSFEDQSDDETLLLHASAAKHLASQTSRFVCENLCSHLLSSVAKKGRLSLRVFD